MSNGNDWGCGGHHVRYGSYDEYDHSDSGEGVEPFPAGLFGLDRKNYVVPSCGLLNVADPLSVDEQYDKRDQHG